MPKKSKNTKPRTKVKDIPQAVKALSKGQQKKIKGAGVDWSGPGDEGPEESITFVFGKAASVPKTK